MKLFVLIVIAFILLLLDVSFLPFFGFGNVYSSLLTIYFFVYCVHNEKHDIVWFSLFIGFLQDMFLDSELGMNMLLNLVVGIVLYLVSMKCNKSKYILYTFIISIMCVLKSLILVCYMFISLGFEFNFIKLFYEFMHAFVLSLFMYPILSSMFRAGIFKKSLEF